MASTPDERPRPGEDPSRHRRDPARDPAEARLRMKEHDEAKAHRGEDAAELDRDEEKKAEEEEHINALVIHEVIRREGQKELERPPSALAWSALAGGLSMGLSMVAEGVLHAHLPDAPWRPLVAKLGYPVGFLAVILGSQQLFTENTLTPIVPLMAKRTRETLAKVLKLWGIVLLLNLVGTLLFALAIAHTTAFSPEVKHAFDAIGRQAMEGSTMTIFVKAIFAGWIIALLVWMLPAASNAKVPVIIIMTWLVGAAQLAHVIVGSAEVFYLAATNGTTWGRALSHFLLPALLGNILGGISIVAAINHAQVAAGNSRKREAKHGA